jgi:hypothetical protein
MLAPFNRRSSYIHFLITTFILDILDKFTSRVEMSLDMLPPELLGRISLLILAQQDRIAKYATISRAWQHTIEHQTFSHLALVNDELNLFKSAVLESTYECRRLAVRHVDFSVNLPSYDDHACGRFERQADRHLNDQVLSKALAALFVALKMLDVGGRRQPVGLHFRDFYSAMDRDRRERSNLEADMVARRRGQRHDLFDLRYRDTYLQLLNPENIPQLYNVASLTVAGNGKRKLAPAIVAGLMSRLPDLAAVDCSFWDNERRRPDRRRHLRSQLAEQLEKLSAPKQLGKFSLIFVNRPPSNSNFVDADVRGSFYPPQTDDLSTALRLFTKGAPCLTNLVLGGPISVDPELFKSSDQTDADTEKRWEALESFNLCLSPIRPDGGWYIELDSERDTESSDEEEEDIWQEDDDDTDYGYRSGVSSSSFDSSDSFFATDQLPPDGYGYEDEKRDERLNGDEPSTSNFRTKPTLELEALFLAAAIAASQMPMLKHMRVGLEIGPSGRTNQRSRRLGFEYRTANDLSSSNRTDKSGVRQLKWQAPRDWRMNERLKSQWTSLIGDNDIIEYDEW